MKKHPLSFIRYDVALLFLVFALSSIYDWKSAILVIPATIIFAIAYLFLVRDILAKCNWLFWFLILAYIYGMVVFGDVNFVWYFFFATNLLVYKFNADWFSWQFILFYLTLFGAVTTVVVRDGMTAVNAMQLLVVLVFIMGITVASKKDHQARLIKQELVEKNRTINILSAENERNRIGRDLHDTLGHTFAMMTLKTELALKQLENKQYDSAKQQIEDINRISHESMYEVREIVNNLKYRTVAEELQEIERLFDLSGISLQLTNKLELESLSPVLQSTITMVLRELTNNVVKHSEARHCRLTLGRYENSKLFIECEDDGLGFKELTGQELKSIRERLQLVNGTSQVVSLKHPTTVRIELQEGDRV